MIFSQKTLLVVAVLPCVIGMTGQANAQSFGDFLRVVPQIILEEALENQRPTIQSAPRVADAAAARTVAERRHMQAALKSLGFYNGDIDGQFGPQTRRSIAAYQSSLGASATGYLTDGQVDVLLDIGVAATASSNPSPAAASASASGDDIAAVAPNMMTFGHSVRNGELFLKPGLERGYRGIGGGNALKRMLLLGSDPLLLETSTLQYAIVLGDKLQPYFTEDAMRSLGRNDDVFLPQYTWLGRDEFEIEDTRLRFIEEMGPGLIAAAPSLPMIVAVMLPVGTGDYSNERGGFPLNVSWDNGGFRLGNDDYALPNLSVPQPVQLPDFLPMTTDEGRELRALQRNLAEQPLDPRFFDYEINRRNASPLFLIVRYRLNALSMQGIDAVADTTVLDMGLYASNDLLTPLRVIPLPEPEVEMVAEPEAIPRPTAPAEVVPPPPTDEELRVKAVLAGSVDMPSSRFDLLGVKLGMPLEEARALFVNYVGDKPHSELSADVDYADGVCGTIQRNLRADVTKTFAETVATAEGAGQPLDLAQATRDQQALRERYVDEFAGSNCTDPLDFVLDVAFGFDIQHENGMTERLLIYRASQTGEVVGAVGREVSYGFEEMLLAGLEKKYGPVDTDYADSRRYWVEDPAMRPLLSDDGPGDCYAGYVENLRIPTRFLTDNCGAFLEEYDHAVKLVDTRYNSIHAALIQQRAARIEAERKVPAIAF